MSQLHDGDGHLETSEDLQCVICHQSLERMTDDARQLHYETHFQETDMHQSEPASPKDFQSIRGFASTSKSIPPESSASKSSGQFWSVSRAVHSRPPPNYTPNLIPLLRGALNRSHSRGTTQRAALCQEGLCHISGEFFDTGWGCGYRNFLMACTSLYEQQVIPQYFSLLEQDGGPGVRNLQDWLEKAWAEGFDPIGAEDLKGKLVGTRKWIGTAEIYTAFTYRGIPARIVEFPQAGNDPEAVTRWVANYFFPPPTSKNVHSALNGASPIIQTDKPPLILQHQGHSRTIVGIELNRIGAPNLLVFDPGRKIPATLRAQALSSLPSVHSTTPKSSGNTRTEASFSKSVFEKLMPHKRPRFEDQDEEDFDSERQNGKRGKNLYGHILKRPQNREDPDHMSVLKVFRLTLGVLKRRDKYQILMFTLEPPLSDEERSARKIVQGEEVI